MKKNSNKKRWFYDLTERQVYKIIAVFEVVVFMITVRRIVTNWPSTEWLEQNGFNTTTAIICTIVVLFVLMVLIGLAILMLLWDNPKKQFYLSCKEHDEETVPKVRKKFGLSSEFKEVLHKPKDQMHWFAKETEDGILVSQRDEKGEELKSELIEDYGYFDLNYQPKL